MTEILTPDEQAAIVRERLRAYEAERVSANLDRAVAIAWDDTDSQAVIEQRLARLNAAIQIHLDALDDLGVQP